MPLALIEVRRIVPDAARSTHGYHVARVNKIVLFLIAVVLIGIAGFALLWFGVGGESQKAAEAILADWQQGRVDAIYRGADESFRAGNSPDRFKAYLEYWRARRGAFEAVKRRTNAGISKDDGEMRKRVSLLLQFARGEAEGHFEFKERDGALALVHVSFNEIPAAVDKADNGVLDAAAHALFMLYNEKNITGLYAALSGPLQQKWRPADVETQLLSLHHKAGRIDENFKQRELKEEDKGDRRILVYDIAFEKAPGEAVVGFQWDDDHWKIVEFRLRITPK